MISARVSASLLLAAAAGHCSAQEFVRHSLSFLEVVAGTNNPVPVPNGRIDPGEGARISLTIAFSPAVGTTVTYTPPPPPGTGTVAGFGMTAIDLDILGGAAGAWSFITRQSAWALGGQGQPQPTTGVTYIMAGQFILSGMTANSQNPIPDIWSGVWTPASYAAGSIPFRTHLSGEGSSWLILQYGYKNGPLYVGKQVSSLHDPAIVIPIAPAPAAAPVLLLAAALAGHRGRHAHRAG
jgi:hypothetical protein